MLIVYRQPSKPSCSGQLISGQPCFSGAHLPALLSPHGLSSCTSQVLNSGCFLCRTLDFGSLTSFWYLRRQVHKWTHVLLITLGFSRRFGHVLFCLLNYISNQEKSLFHSSITTLPTQFLNRSPLFPSQSTVASF